MLTNQKAGRHSNPIARLLLRGGVIALLCLVFPTLAWADPGSGGPDLCAECHPAEALAWQHSPHAQALADIQTSLPAACAGDVAAGDCECLECHTTNFDPVLGSYAQAGVTCEACHGLYVADHPQSGAMQLDVSSSNCRDCHTTTYGEWEGTGHAGAGVQCISCHQSHVQQTRKADEALCGSCHRDRLDDFAHTAHKNANVSCDDCHLAAHSTAADISVADISVSQGGLAPDHSFTVGSQTCAGCHGSSIHVKAPGEEVDQIYNVRLAGLTEYSREQANELEELKQTNRSLKTLSVVSLGLGLGVGGMLGIIFVLGLGYVSQRGKA